MLNKTKEDFLVTGLEQVEPAYAQFPGKMYAGTLPIDRDGRRGEMMFWLFEPDAQSVPETIAIWLNGGPGCSSFNCGVMMEHSPVTQPLHDAGYCCLKATPDLFYNDYTWTKVTTMLYIEQPIGTGFSYGSPLPETESDVSADLDQFLQNFYKVFTHLQPYKFFVTGESYAGMFVPSIARWIHKENERAIAHNDTDRIMIPLAGASLGNGWVDAKTQGPATIDYSWYHGLIDKPTRDALHVEWANCMAKQGSGSDVEPPPFHPFNVQDDCGIMWGILQAAGNPNAYDISTWDPNVDQVTFTSEGFYNSAPVKAALNAPTNITWHGCRWGEGRRRLTAAEEMHRRLYMDKDRPLNVAPYMAELLDAGIPVLVYNGDRDMTTNMVGSELVLNQMNWTGSDEWLDADRGLWMVDGQPAGWSKELKALTFLVVYNSGHMVPYNRPIPSMDLIERFVTAQSFRDIDLPKIRVEPIDHNAKPIRDVVDHDIAVAHNMQADLLPSASNLGLGSSSSRHWETAGVAGLGMMVGFALAMMVVGRGGDRRRRGRYERVPDAALE